MLQYTIFNVVKEREKKEGLEGKREVHLAVLLILTYQREKEKERGQQKNKGRDMFQYSFI